MNIYDVSERSGVSIATVSRVLNNSPHVSAKTRAKVLAVMEECGYVPNAFARGLGLNSMKTIGIVCAYSIDSYSTHALFYLESALRKHGYNCLVIFCGNSRESRVSSIESIRSRHVDGIILVGSSFVESSEEKNEHIRTAANHIPVVILNGSLDFENVYCVLFDDFRAAKDATLHLIRTGFKRILHLYHSDNDSGKRKLAGYREALLESGLDVDQELIVPLRVPVECEHEHFSLSQDQLTQLREEGLRFDAVFASADGLAVGAIKYARVHQLSIPDEFSVIGYNNANFCLCTVPELSSVATRLPTLCQQCADIIAGVLENREMPHTTIFNGELIKRGSTL